MTRSLLCTFLLVLAGCPSLNPGACQDRCAEADMAMEMGVPDLSATDMLSPPDRGPSGPRGGCSPDGWCWKNPLPQGGLLLAVFGKDRNNVWAVGTLGTIIKYDGTTWNSQLSDTTRHLYAVWS